MTGVGGAEKDVGGHGARFSSLEQCKKFTVFINNQLPGSPHGNREESKILYIKYLEPCQVHSVIEMLVTVTGKGH